MISYRETTELTSWELWLHLPRNRTKLGTVEHEFPVIIFNPGTETEYEALAYSDDDIIDIFKDNTVYAARPNIRLVKNSTFQLIDIFGKTMWTLIAELYCTSHTSIHPLRR